MRVSMYIQSLLFLLIATVSVFDGRVDSRERKTLNKTCTTLLIVANALLIAAFTQTATSSLSFYHALVVLDLSWMLAANVVIICVLPTLDSQIESKWHHRLHSFWPARPGHMAAMMFVSAHLSLTGILGLYVWANPTRVLGTSPGCAQATITYVLFTPISATNPRLRIASLVLSSIAALPILNVAVLTVAAVAVVNFANVFVCQPYTFRRLYRITMLILAVVNVLFIANTELTVRRNRHLVDGNESRWGLGQILALLILMGPIIHLATVSLGNIRNRAWVKWKGQVDYRFRRCLRESEESWSAACQRSHQDINKVLRSLPLGDIPAGLKGIVAALTTAQIFLGAPDKWAKAKDPAILNADDIVDDIAASDHPTTPKEISVDGMKRGVGDIFDRMSVVCKLRFPDVQDPCSRSLSEPTWRLRGMLLALLMLPLTHIACCESRLSGTPIRSDRRLAVMTLHDHSSRCGDLPYLILRCYQCLFYLWTTVCTPAMIYMFY